MVNANQGAESLGLEVVKEYPQRGQLRQYRLARPTSFTCNRCSLENVSKLVATVNGNWDALLCNGCYGWLLSQERTDPQST